MTDTMTPGQGATLSAEEIGASGLRVAELEGELEKRTQWHAIACPALSKKPCTCQAAAAIALLAQPDTHGAALLAAADRMAQFIGMLTDCKSITWPTGQSALDEYRRLRGRGEVGE